MPAPATEVKPVEKPKTVAKVEPPPAEIEKARGQKHVALEIPTDTASRVVARTTSKGILEEMQPDLRLSEQFATLEQRAFEGVPEAQHDLATLYAAGDVR